jgi:hypothetical protein
MPGLVSSSPLSWNVTVCKSEAISAADMQRVVMRVFFMIFDDWDIGMRSVYYIK